MTRDELKQQIANRVKQAQDHQYIPCNIDRVVDDIVDIVDRYMSNSYFENKPKRKYGTLITPSCPNCGSSSCQIDGRNFLAGNCICTSCGTRYFYSFSVSLP